MNNVSSIIHRLNDEHAFLRELPLGIESVSGIDGREIDLYRYLRENKCSKHVYNQLIRHDRFIAGHHLTPGGLGCLESHALAWHRVLRLNRSMLILEDDVQLHGERLSLFLPHLLASLPSNFSLLYFGNLVGKAMTPKLTEFNTYLWKVNGSTWGTYAYLISPSAARILLNFLYPVSTQIDSMIIDIAQSQSLDVFMTKEIFIKTDNRDRRMSTTQRYLVSPIVIPRIFHLISLSPHSLSARARHHLQLWTRFHPQWQLRLWTREILRNTSLTIYNHVRWSNSSLSIEQASHLLRYEIIYQYGGIFADLDMQPLANLEPLLHGLHAFVAYRSDNVIGNDLFGAIPGHSLTQSLVTRLEANWLEFDNASIDQQTGSAYLTRLVEEMKTNKEATMKHSFQIFAPHLFFPASSEPRNLSYAFPFHPTS